MRRLAEEHEERRLQAIQARRALMLDAVAKTQIFGIVCEFAHQRGDL
jgi:hypothetical protein